MNVTSIKGLLSTPLNAAYNISKFGGETFSEITRMEMRQFGVKVSIIEPGNFGGATGCINKEGVRIYLYFFVRPMTGWPLNS